MAEDNKHTKKKKGYKARHLLYDNGVLKNNSCPKCGTGFLLANHNNRRVCGKCGYVEAKNREPKP